MKAVSKITFKENSTDASVKVLVGSVESAIGFREGKELLKGSELQTLESAGMTLDYSYLIEQYEDMLENREEVLAQQKIDDLKVRYNKMHFVKTVYPAFEGVTVSVLSEEQFLKQSHHQFGQLPCTLSYKGRNTTINIGIGGADRFGRGGSIRFQICEQITDYRTRSFVTFKAAVNKFKELVDESIEREAREEQNKINSKAIQSDKVQQLIDLFGSAKCEKKTERRSYGNKNIYHEVTVYKVITANREIVIVPNNDFTAFTLSGLSGLTVDQVKAILAIV
jgi:hypothetical protein